MKRSSHSSSKVVCRRLIDGLHVLDQIDDPVGVAHLVVVPGHQLDKGLGQLDAGLGVEDRRAMIADKVRGHQVLVSVAEIALERPLGGGLDGRTDLHVGRLLGQPDGQVDDRDIWRGDAEGHAGQLAGQLGNDLADGLGRTGGGGDDVLAGTAAATPVLATGAVHRLLGGSHGVHGGHQT